MLRSPEVRTLLLVGALCAAAQLSVATWAAPSFGTPNASTVLARTLVETGEYGTLAWPTRDPRAPGAVEPLLRAYLLPAEPLLQAAAFASLPPAFWRYLHVPVTVVLVLAITAVAIALGGARLGLIAGLLATVDPFMLRHGTVWDDTFLAAAVEWSLGACLVWTLTGSPCCARLRARPALAALALAAMTGALTRLPAQITIAAAGLLTAVAPRFRIARAAGLALVLGVAIGVLGWGARNQLVLGQFFIGTSHDGITLLESTSPAARPSILATGTAEAFAARALASHYRAVETMGELEANAYFRRAAWASIADAPFDAALTGIVKVGVSLGGVHFGEPLWSVRNVVAVGFNAALWFAAMAGVRRWRRVPRTSARDFGRYAASIVLVTTLAMLMLGPVGLRYRVTLAGVLYVLAAGALVAPSGGMPTDRDSAPPAPNDIASS